MRWRLALWGLAIGVVAGCRGGALKSDGVGMIAIDGAVVDGAVADRATPGGGPGGPGGISPDAGPTTPGSSPLPPVPPGACAPAPGQPPQQAPAPSPELNSCFGTISNPALWSGIFPDLLRLAPIPRGHSFVRCGTVGPETAWQVTLSPDASRLAALTSAGTVHLFETRNWMEIAELAAQVGALDALAFSPDGAQLATLASEMGTVTLWNAADGKLSAHYGGPPMTTVMNPPGALAFSTDGRRVATSLGTVIDRATGAMTSWYGQPLAPFVASPNPEAAKPPPRWSATSLRFVGCDQRLLVDAVVPGTATSTWTRQIQLIDPASGASVPLAAGHFENFGGVSASPDGRWIAIVLHGSIEADRQGVRLVDAATASLIGRDVTATDALVGFSPASDRLYTTTGGEIQVRDVPSLAIRARLVPPSPAQAAVGISPRGEIIVSTPDATAWLDADTGKVLRRSLFQIGRPSFSADGRYGVSSGAGALFRLWSDADASARCAPPAPRAEKAIAGMALSPDGKTLALVDDAGIAELRAVDGAGAVGPAWNSIATGLAPRLAQTWLAVANGGARVAARGLPAGTAPSLPPVEPMSRVVVVDVATGGRPVSLDLARANGQLALSPDGAWLAFQDGKSDASALSVVAVDTGFTELLLRNGVYREPDSFSPDSKRLAVATAGGMEIWDLPAGTLATTYAIAGSVMKKPALAPDWSVMGGIVSPVPYTWYDSVAMVWRPEDGSVVRRIGMPMDFVTPPRFDATAAIVAVPLFEAHTFSTEWNAWHVWSVATGEALRSFGASSAPDEPLVILPGGDRLLTRAGSALAVWCR